MSELQTKKLKNGTDISCQNLRRKKVSATSTTHLNYFLNPLLLTKALIQTSKNANFMKRSNSDT